MLERVEEHGDLFAPVSGARAGAAGALTLYRSGPNGRLGIGAADRRVRGGTGHRGGASVRRRRPRGGDGARGGGLHPARALDAHAAGRGGEPRRVGVGEPRGRSSTSSTRWRRGSTSDLPPPARSPGHCRAGASATLAAEAGLVMGYLSSRVLGQYDVSLLGAETEPRLLFVGPNLARAVRDLEVERRRFGRWICAHELTHVFQFQGVPWLREHMAGAAARYLETLEVRIEKGAGRRAAVAAGPRSSWRRSARAGSPRWCRARNSGPDGPGPGGDVGDRGLLGARDGRARRPSSSPATRSCAPRWSGAARSRSAPQRIIERLLGFDVKLRQYEQGKKWATRWRRSPGSRALNRVWASPTRSPPPSELQHPGQWLKRTEPPRLTAA